MTARCMVGGCGWAAENPSSVRLAALAEGHRRLAHAWVKPGRCHELIQPEPDPQVEVDGTESVPAAKPARLRQGRGGNSWQ